MNRTLCLLCTVAFAFITSGHGQQVQQVDYLEPRNVIGDHVTLSGFSSGGTMAQMMQMAYSSFFQGIGIFSHTFMRCGPPNGVVEDWDRVCTTLFNTTEDKLYDPELVHKDIRDYYAKGLIENPQNLRDKRLYVYTGLRNFLFSPVQGLRILQVWEKYIRNPYRIKTRVQDSVFVMPTDNNYGYPCSQDSTDNFFIGNCGFSGAYEALKFLHQDYFQIHHPQKQVQYRLQKLRQFNQTVYLKGLTTHQMDDVGFYYVPTRCQDPNYPCLLHVFFHGCWNNRNLSGDNFITNSGYLEIAEANNIIMLFPQNNPVSLKDGPARGCWDTFGVGGELYATKDGHQVQAVWRIIRGIIAGPTPSAEDQVNNPANVVYGVPVQRYQFV